MLFYKAEQFLFHFTDPLHTKQQCMSTEVGCSKCDCSGQHYCCAQTTDFISVLKKTTQQQSPSGNCMYCLHWEGCCSHSQCGSVICQVNGRKFQPWSAYYLLFCSSQLSQSFAVTSNNIWQQEPPEKQIVKLTETKWSNCHLMVS